MLSFVPLNSFSLFFLLNALIQLGTVPLERNGAPTSLVSMTITLYYMKVSEKSI
jgi:hypothetical protein